MKFSISHLEQLSGVPIHTIRIWERRYHALTPDRSEGNTRIYSDAHLKRLLDIVSMVQAGIKISAACSYTQLQINSFLENEINKTVGIDERHEFYISQLVKYGLTFNEVEFSRLLEGCFSNYTIEKSYQNIIYPVLQRIGFLWRKDEACPAQEHFITNIIRQKLMVAIAQIPLASLNKSTWLLCLPEDEGHDIPLLFANYLLRNNGFKVIYLGEKIPTNSIQNAIHQNNIAHLLLFMVRQRPLAETNKLIHELSNQNPDINIHLSGNKDLITSLQLDQKINYLPSIAAFITHLHQLSHAN
ncbi:MAG: MerR family transcriptional regulator [Bacteroidota bacterium]